MLETVADALASIAKSRREGEDLPLLVFDGFTGMHTRSSVPVCLALPLAFRVSCFQCASLSSTTPIVTVWRFI